MAQAKQKIIALLHGRKSANRWTFKKILHDIGPGIVSGAADHDPAGIVTYAIMGATTGFTQLWLVLLSCPLLIYTLATCAKIGDVTKKGLASLIRQKFGPKIAAPVMILLIVANIATLGADFAGLGSVLSLLFPKVTRGYFPLLVGLLLLLILSFKEYRSVHRYLLFFSLLLSAYILAGLIASPDWRKVLINTFIPKIRFNRQSLVTGVAFLGTTITPFLFYWQTTEEIEDHPTVKDALSEHRKIATGIIFASLTAYFVVLTSAMAFFEQGIEIQTAADAAQGLFPLFGQKAYLFFAVGLVASGMLAITVIASTTAYVIAETFKWKEGLNKKISQAKGFYTVLTASLVMGVLISQLEISAMKVILYSQVFNGILSPLLLALVVILASSEEIMGRFRHQKKEVFWGWLIVGFMATAAGAIFFA